MGGTTAVAIGSSVEEVLTELKKQIESMSSIMGPDSDIVILNPFTNETRVFCQTVDGVPVDELKNKVITTWVFIYLPGKEKPTPESISYDIRNIRNLDIKEDENLPRIHIRAGNVSEAQKKMASLVKRKKDWQLSADESEWGGSQFRELDEKAEWTENESLEGKNLGVAVSVAANFGPKPTKEKPWVGSVHMHT